MIEQYTALEEIPGLESLVEHFRNEYGNDFLARVEDSKLRISVSLTPKPAHLQWRRDQQSGVYEVKAFQGYVVGYRFKGSVFHNRERGTCHLPLEGEQYVTLTIQCNYPSEREKE